MQFLALLIGNTYIHTKLNQIAVWHEPKHLVHAHCRSHVNLITRQYWINYKAIIINWTKRRGSNIYLSRSITCWRRSGAPKDPLILNVAIVAVHTCIQSIFTDADKRITGRRVPAHPATHLACFTLGVNDVIIQHSIDVLQGHPILPLRRIGRVLSHRHHRRVPAAVQYAQIQFSHAV